MNCQRCKYNWVSRGLKNPKSCPKCKVRLDYGKYQVLENGDETHEQ